MKNILVVVALTQAEKQRLEQNLDGYSFIYKNRNELTKEDFNDIDVIFGNPNPELVAYAENLKLLQLESSGVNPYLNAKIPNDAVLCCSTGAYGHAIGEHMLATLLMAFKKLHLYFTNQKQSLWQDEGKVKTIMNSRVLVVGLGDIGSHFAKNIKALGGYTIGIKRRVGDKPEYLDELYSMDSLDEILPTVDVVALSLPSTKHTVNTINATRLSLMKKDAVLLNVGRGDSINTDDLYEFLANNKDFTCCLDVVNPEPLPAQHPLWKLDNALITPHISGDNHLDYTTECIIDIAVHNIKAVENNTELKSVVDFASGYSK